MNLTSPTAKMCGRYKIEAFTPGNPPRVLADWFDNLITDFGLNSLGGDYAYLNYCSVGTGNAQPAYSDTNLSARRATTDYYSNHLNSSTSDYITWKRVYQFNAGAASGNLAEVGVGAGYNGTQLFSRTLIKDALGNPATITVLPDEILQVTWELRLLKPEPVSGEVVINGSGTHSYTIEALPGRASSGTGAGLKVCPVSPGAYTSEPDYGQGYLSYSKMAYVPNSFKITSRFTAGISVANFPAGISYIEFELCTIAYSGYKLKMTFDPPIIKTNEQKLTLDVLVSWGRG